jgi:hypothetical protein
MTRLNLRFRKEFFMRHTFTTATLAIASISGFLTALIAALYPARFAQSLGLSIVNAGGINEIRAQYAGFFLAVCLLCAGSLSGVVPRAAAFVVLTVVFAGLVGGRFASLALNRGVSGYPQAILALYAIDSLGLVLSITGLAFSRQR